MKTFLDFLNEANAVSGNYVSIGATLDQGDIDLRGGVFTKSPHVTLMYSEESTIDDKLIHDVLSEYTSPVVATYTGIDIFGETEDKHAVVIKLNSDTLHEIHEKLKSIGLKHTYEFQPHLTFAYKLTNDNALKMKDDLDGLFEGKEFTLKGFDVTAIDKNWVDSDD